MSSSHRSLVFLVSTLTCTSFVIAVPPGPVFSHIHLPDSGTKQGQMEMIEHKELSFEERLLANGFKQEHCSLPLLPHQYTIKSIRLDRLCYILNCKLDDFILYRGGVASITFCDLYEGLNTNGTNSRFFHDYGYVFFMPGSFLNSQYYIAAIAHEYICKIQVLRGNSYRQNINNTQVTALIQLRSR